MSIGKIAGVIGLVCLVGFVALTIGEPLDRRYERTINEFIRQYGTPSLPYDEREINGEKRAVLVWEDRKVVVVRGASNIRVAIIPLSSRLTSSTEKPTNMAAAQVGTK